MHSLNRIRKRPRSPVSTVCFVLSLFIGCSSETPNSTSHSKSGSKALTTAAEQSVSESIQEKEQHVEDQPEAQTETEDPSYVDPAQLHMKAFDAFHAGDGETAFALSRQALRMAPNDPQVVFLMAMILGERKRYPEAIQMLDQLEETEPDLRLAIMGQTAEWMVRSGRWSEAEKRYRVVLKEAPSSVRLHRNLAELMLRQGRSMDAVVHCRYLCRLGNVMPTELQPLLNATSAIAGDAENSELAPIGVLGKARQDIASGDWLGARTRLEAVDELAAEGLELLGRTYLELGDFDAIEQWVVQASTLSEPHSDAWLVRGAIAAHRNEHVHAVGCFLKSLLLDHASHRAYSLLSESLIQLKAHEKAQEVARRAELIERTHKLGRDFAEGEKPDARALIELIGLLEQLRRPLEALAWREIQFARSHSGSSISEAEVAKFQAEIAAARSRAMEVSDEELMRRFVLCGVDVARLK